jgi:protein tyrosine phosphatase (PTP) superfamily phosphohydrolase (DUF442 family)
LKRLVRKIDHEIMTTAFETLSQIEAFVPVSPHLATSGQPTALQFTDIQAAGYSAVLNLAMPSSSNWLPEESTIVTDLGMTYHHIPVLWENPILDDFDRIADILDEHKEQKIWVHCAKNMRVSAMIYLYNRLKAGLTHEVAWRYVEQVWQPNEVWYGFIEATIELYANN